MSRSPNNFGALRLLFAVLVILSHSPELVDGNKSREILTAIFGTLSFGAFGVNGFFLISGYLITKSYCDSRLAGEYFFKRVLRIYPGYVVSYLLCVLVLAPLVGGQIGALSPKALLDIVFLQDPRVEGVFAGTPRPYLNNSMWTIAYEFRCYMLVLALGTVGLLSKRLVVLALTAVSLALTTLCPNIFWSLPNYGITYHLFGDPYVMVRFAGIFGCGSLFYLYADSIRYDWRFAAVSACALIGLMFSPRLAEPATATFGAYLLFWFAFTVRSETLASIGQRTDLSYGTYLYAWPVQKVLIWMNPGISPWVVFIATTVIAGCLAFGSWRLVENPCLRLKASLSRRGRPAPILPAIVVEPRPAPASFRRPRVLPNHARSEQTRLTWNG